MERWGIVECMRDVKVIDDRVVDVLIEFHRVISKFENDISGSDVGNRGGVRGI